ncbi:aspartate dehydrogenase [Psychromicrobium silvestre]|uniref:L-aspartate dehydrogenase n=1 Tax=Psychromicrobium silvestre TaxID=1645614 RepID=A0A7Y9LS04_9MICC|nr:aspartate dehydrogenase domain-containing protein [Psychromicrobium silvestre]NYE94526.1 aspartate dehydrogenase [Psychromicrobium silvestre]
MALNLAMIGDGAIATALRNHLNGYPQLKLVGIVSRHPLSARSERDGVSRLDLDQALDSAEVLVEAAGVDAVGEYGARIISAGKAFLVTSIGAFADPLVRAAVLESGPGRTFPTTGAIGGLDLISAAAASGGITTVNLETRKKPAALIQDWMDTGQRSELLQSVRPVTVFSGTPAEAIAKFPASLNVAVALGLATGDLERVRVRLIADPQAELTEHLITAEGAAGEYCFQIRNQPDPEQPRSSGLTARSLLAGLLRLAEPSGKFI